MSEIKLQSVIFQWVWNFHPKTRRCLWHVPNGQGRSKIEAMMLKSSGVVAGVHDLHFIWEGKFYVFELKFQNGKQSKEQLLWGECVKAQGAIAYEIRTFEEFKDIFLRILESSEFGA